MFCQEPTAANSVAEHQEGDGGDPSGEAMPAAGSAEPRLSSPCLARPERERCQHSWAGSTATKGVAVLDVIVVPLL